MEQSTKTPITVLQTYCARHDLHPEFDLISTHGRVHEPTFVYLVRIEGPGVSLQVKISGLSKKKAKQSAALKALQLLAESSEEAANELKSLESSYLNELVQETGNEAAANKSNPVGKLQETCVKKKWTPPIYETDDEDGPAHDKKFTVCCRLENLKVVAKGVDRSKKGAKKLAALEMLNFLEREGICDLTDETEKSAKENESENLHNKRKSDPFANISKIKSKASPEVLSLLQEKNSQFFKSHESFNYCRELELISDKLGCRVEYITRDDKLVTVFAQIRSIEDNSLLVTGWGKDVNDVERGKQDSASKAIFLLKILLSS